MSFRGLSKHFALLTNAPAPRHQAAGRAAHVQGVYGGRRHGAWEGGISEVGGAGEERVPGPDRPGPQFVQTMAFVLHLHRA